MGNCGQSIVAQSRTLNFLDDTIVSALKGRGTEMQLLLLIVTC